MNFAFLRNLAAKTAVAIACVTALSVSPVHAQGIPVIDPSNLRQNVVTALQSVAMAAQQVQQYQTQLQQYENQLQNTLAPSQYLWDQANSTMQKLIGAYQTFNNVINSNGGLQNLLGQFGSVSSYSSMPCLNSSTCSASDLQALQQRTALGSQTQKAANDSLFNVLDQQQQSLQADAANLQSLQTNATSAQGQMAALQSANQLASNISNQILQIRAVLVAQQQTEAARHAAQVDKEAKQQAASTQFRSGTYQPSSGQGF